MLSRMLEILLPIFSIVLLGFLYARRVKPDLSGATRIASDIGLPALTFSALSATPLLFSNEAFMLLGATLVLLGSALLSWAVARPIGMDPRAFVPSMVFGNVGPVGLPLALLAFGPEGLKAAVLMMVMANIYHFTFGVQVFSGHTELRPLLRNPLIWATIAGLTFSWFHWSLPAWMNVTIKTLGEILIPIMLLSMGARLTSVPWTAARIGILGGAFGPISRLIPALLCVALLPMTPVQKGALLLFAALPSAIFNYLLAERYRREPMNVVAIVLIGHLLCIVFLPIGVYLALQSGH